MTTNPQYMVTSQSAPKVELTDAGLYVRFIEDAEVAETIVQSSWPHVAVDLNAAGEVIGIECVPAPAAFNLGKIAQIAKDAKVGGLPRYNAADVEIQNICADKAA